MDIWVNRLVKEYEESKKYLKEYRQQLDPLEEEHSIVGGMVSDMQHALEWMRRGRRPGNRRGIERRSVYQRTALLDMNLFPSLDIEPMERTLSDREKRELVDILWTLSNRERQCYLLHQAQGMSYREIAEELKLGRSTVQKFIERARNKIMQKVS